MRKRVPLPAYLPDKLPRGDVLTVATNVYPAEEGYRAAPGFIGISDSLPAMFMGAASFVSSDGTSSLIAGHANGLSRLTGGLWTPLLVAVAVPSRWNFAQFGDFAIAVNSGVTQQVNLVTRAASELSGAPTASDVAVVGDFVVYAQPNGDLLRVRWSGFGDHTKNALGVDQAGDQPMLTGGEVMGLAGGEYGVILQRQRLVRMSRTGDATAPFQFDEITPNVGCASKASIAQSGRTVFFLSDRGFMALDDGQALRPIGNEKFDRSFRMQVSSDDYERLWSVVDPARSLVMWGSPGSSGTVWVYNWVLDRVTTLEMSFDALFSGFETSVSLEDLNSLYPDLDTMPYSLDDPRFSGGAPRLYFVRDNAVGTLAGPNMPATLEQGQFAAAGEKKLRVQAVWPDTDATGGVTVTLGGRQRKGDDDITRRAERMQQSGRMPVQINARYLAVRIEIDNPDWSYIDGYELEGSPGGDR